MKMILALCALGSAALATPAAAQQKLPAGTYSITGTFSSFTGAFCTLSPTTPITGTLLYPGIGKATTYLLLQSVTPKKTVALQMLSAFPPVPAAGLNGWTRTKYASPNFTTFANGKGKQGGASARISFALTNFFTGGLSPTQGTITIDASGCSETLVATLLRAGDLPPDAP